MLSYPEGNFMQRCLIFTLLYIALPLLLSQSQVEIVRRISPDGSIIEYVPQKQPSLGQLVPRQPAPSPCINKPWDPTNLSWARDAYAASLHRLRIAPKDRQCREQALHFGRIYSRFTRVSRLDALYHETRIMHDIAVITGDMSR